MWDGVTQAIVQQQLPDSSTEFRSIQATSSKNYQWLALSVCRALQSGDRRLVREAFSALSRPLRASLSPARAGQLDADQQNSRFSYNTLAVRSADSDDERLLPSPSPMRGVAGNRSLSVSPRLPRATVAATASWELGLQTLADVVRARMKQGLRSWATYARQHRLQDLHSSVLQALHKSVQDVASPVPAAPSAAEPDERQPATSQLPKQLQTAQADLQTTPRQQQARLSHSQAAQAEAKTITLQQSRLNESHAAPAEVHTATMQQARLRRLKIQAGAKIAGRKYHGDSVRLRCKERHVRAKERSHGPHHPEVGHALLQLARHHGERGAVSEQQAALSRALEAHQRHLEEHQPAVHQPQDISQNVHHLQRRVRELEQAEASARRLLEEKRAPSAESLQSRRAAAVMGLLEGPAESNQHLGERSTDAIVRELYADQARVAEVIKLASKLWDSGILSVAPRRPPLLKSSLLLRLADRCYHGAMRDALQFWWRRCSLQKAAEEITRNGGVWPVPMQKQPDAHDQRRHTVGGHDQARAGGVWQDPRHSRVSTPRQGSTENSRDECHRLREELQALQDIVAQHTAAHDGQQGVGHVWEENSRLRAELQEMRDAMAAPKSHRSLELSEHQTDLHSEPSQTGAPYDHHLHGSLEPALIVEQPDGIHLPERHEEHSGSSRRPSSSSKQHVQLSSGGSRRPSVEAHHQSAPDEDHLRRITPRGQVSLHIKSAHDLMHVDASSSEPGALDPFVAARVGNQEFRTKPVRHSTSPVWNSQMTFTADLNSVNKRVLLLRVMNHHLFECGENLGSTEVPLASLKPGKTTTRQDKLHDGDGGVLDFEICFTPENGPEGAHRYEEGRGWTGLEDVVTPRPVDHHCAPTPNGALECRIIAGHNLKNTDTHALDHGVSDPFVVVRLGRKEFKTKTIYDNLNPVWDMKPFSFKSVDLDVSDLRTLHLKVYNHHVFYTDDCIGFCDVQIPRLEAGKTVRLREMLHDGDGGELEFEVCFMPEGEHAAPATVGETSSGRQSATPSENSRELPLAGDASSRRPSVVSQPHSARPSEHLSSSVVTSGLVVGLSGADAEGLDSEQSRDDADEGEYMKTLKGRASEASGHSVHAAESDSPARLPETSVTSILGAEAESGDEDDDESQTMDDDELANMIPGM